MVFQKLRGCNEPLSLLIVPLSLLSQAAVCCGLSLLQAQQLFEHAFGGPQVM